MTVAHEKRMNYQASRRGMTSDAFVADEARMDELKAAFRDALTCIPSDRPVLYLDYPVHLNVGDLLILKGVEAAFADAGFRLCGRYGWMNFRQSIGDAIEPNTTIVFHGGGNFGDLYPVHQRFRERILGRFPHNPMVVLPQTIHFDSQANLDASARVFRRHPNVTIMVRDRSSFQIARQHFSDQVLLVPDAAHYLWRTLSSPAVEEEDRQIELRLVRKDKEAAENRLASRFGKPTDDWPDLIPRWTQHLFGLVCRMHMFEGLLDCDLNAQSIWYRQSDFIVSHMIKIFSRSDSVRSDRLHACLLGMLLGKRITPLDNTYGKLRHYFDAWFDDMRRSASAG